MDLKLVAVVVLFSLAFVGIVFAVPGLRDQLASWPGEGRNDSAHNATWHSCGAMQNGTHHGCGAMGNGSWQGRMGMFGRGHQGKGLGMGRNDTPRANATEMDEFQQAVQSGDYQTAKGLHDAYGLGGQLFDRLNETTFAKYSEISKLWGELRDDLGLGQHAQFPGMGFPGGMPRPSMGNQTDEK